MEIVAFIHDADSLNRITNHYDLDTEIPALEPDGRLRQRRSQECACPPTLPLRLSRHLDSHAILSL